METSREYNIKDTVLSRWKQEFVAKATQVFEQPQEVQEKEARVAELERMVGKLTMQIELQHLPWRAVPGKKVLSLAALRGALVLCIPEMHYRDQGLQCAAHEYVALLTQYHVQISMASQGKPEENGYAARLMRTFKEGEVDLSDYNNFADAYRQIGRFLEDVYMTKRIHSAVVYLTPIEFETAWRMAQLEQTTPKKP